jgi:RNA-directed DNA polymerase
MQRIEQVKRIKLELRKRLHEKPSDSGRWLKSVVQGQINYYGVPFNSKSLCQLVHEVRGLWLKSLRRRSQRHRTNWSCFTLLADRWIPKPKMVHPFLNSAFTPLTLR